MREVTVNNLLAVLNRAWYDAKQMVRLVRESHLSNIYPAVMVTHGPQNALDIAVEFSTKYQPAVFRKKIGKNMWECVNFKHFPEMTAEEVIKYAEHARKILPADYQPPVATARHGVEMLLANNPSNASAYVRLISSGINVYPYLFNVPETDNPEYLILENTAGHSIVLWIMHHGEKTFFTPTDQIWMSIEDVIAFANS